MIMKIRRLNYVVLLFALFTFLFCGKMTVKAEDRSGLTYYVDAEKGNDNESGRSPEEAWKTLEKVNSMLFQPGDTILFKAEGTWEGQLWPKGSGNEENSIIIDRYGEGKDPYIKGNMDQGAAVYLYNQQYWEINHLEITNNATVKGDRQGICFENQDAGILKHIYVKNCNIHDVTGVEITTGVGSSKCNGGIVGKITTQNPSTGEGAVKSKWEDIIIDGNSVKDLGREGIYFYSYWSIRWGLEEPNAGEYYPSTQVIVSNNKVENVDGDGIVITCCDGALVEHNYVRGANSRPNGKYHAGVWMWSSDNCVFRYNEVCETKTTLDGMAFDFDNCTYGNTPGVIPVCATGNEGNASHHYYGSVSETYTPKNVEFLVSEGNRGFTLELWGQAPQLFSVGFRSPGGETIPRIPVSLNQEQRITFVLERTVIYVNYEVVQATTGSQLILIRMLDPTPGIWTLQVYRAFPSPPDFHIWLPITGFSTSDVTFLEPDPYTTLTTPSATVPVLSPSTYQAANNSFSPESGRGFTRLGEIKPDFAAPGVSVTGPGPAGSYVSFSGSSASAAITSGAAALFLQWGIQRTPARYFTAQEVKNYLIRGADRTDTITYPSREWGYGRLQLYQSFTSLMTN